jgi:restriction system protein
MRPLLATLADGQEHTITSVRLALADRFSLTPDDLEAQLPSGRAKLFANRVGWATTYLYRTGLIERPRRSVYRITDRGRTVLAECPERVDLKVLAQFDEFHEFRARNKTAETPSATSGERLSRSSWNFGDDGPGVIVT